MEEFLKHLVHGLAHKSAHERQHGNKKVANALAMIVIGIVTLPVPFIGLPLIAIGIWKLVT